MDDARRIADRLCGDGRILMHGQALPAIGNLDAQLDAMNTLVEQYPIAAWKVYTHAPRRGSSTTTIRGSRRSGNAFLDHVRETGVKIVSVHKGLGGGSRYAAPVDIGPAASAHPDIRFVVYHSGYEAGNTEGPVRPRRARRRPARPHAAATPASRPARTCTPSSGRRGST